MLIRAACREDRHCWETMRQRLWPSASGEHAGEIDAYFAGRLDNPLEVFIAFDDDDAAIGFAEVSLRNYAEGCRPGSVAFLEGWYVEQAARGRHVGAALVAAVEDWARGQGCTELASDTEIANTESQAAHKALGFEEVSRAVNFRKQLD